MSIVNQRIDAVVRGEVAHMLKRHQFVREGRTFRRWPGEVCLIVNIQASHGNFREHGRFCVNLAVYSAQFMKQKNLPLPIKPKEGHGQLRTRLHPGMTDQDHWWEVGPQTSTEALSLEVARLLDHSRPPWLNDSAAQAQGASDWKTAYGTRSAAPVRSGMAKTTGPDMSIPKKVQENAKKGLELRQEHGFGGTKVGEGVAELLSKGGDVTTRKVRHIAQYWPRHEHDNLDQKGQKGAKPSKGYIAWLLWGGDEGRTWSEGLVQKLGGEKSGA